MHPDRGADPMSAAEAAALDTGAAEMNRLLLSLLAHDLCSPLTVSDQALEYVDRAVAEGDSIDRELLADVRARIRRSLRAIEVVLGVARAEAGVNVGEGAPAGSDPDAAALPLVGVIRAEIDSFEHEAAVHRKHVVLDTRGIAPEHRAADALVLRQALAILIDNAIRYAVPGELRITASSCADELVVRVEDQGPGLSAHREQPGSVGGSGLGLRLCTALAQRAGGSLRLERDAPSGTVFALHLPVAPLG